MKTITTLAIIALSLFAGFNTAQADHHAVASGTFTGQSDHETSGGVRVEKTDSGYVLILGDDFSLDGAPDPKVALGSDGYDKNTLLGKLKKKKGAQTYEIPASIDPSQFNEVWIWCEKFSVPLGVAVLK